MFWTIAGGVCLGILVAYRIIHATVDDWKGLGGFGFLLLKTLFKLEGN